MGHIIEPAASGRSKCRGCGKAITKGDLRFGERLPNPFADEGDMTLWFHLQCAAYKRPEPFSEVVTDAPDPGQYEQTLADGIEHHRLQRINGLEQAPSGRARCRHCKEMIAKDDWRIPLTFFEDGMFNPSGNIHLSCAGDYFGTIAIADRLAWFSGSEPEAIESLLKS